MKDRATTTSDEPEASLGRTLLRAGSEGDHSPDPVFLAGFRLRLREAQEADAAGSVSLGELCWKAVPALGAVAAVLGVACALALSAPAANGVDGEKVLWSLTSTGPAEEIGDDLILSAALLEIDGR
jgi:hypothetical protein